MVPSLSLSANSIIWSTSELEKCSPTEAATLQKSSGPKAPEPVASKAQKTVCRVASLVESPPKPKISTKVPKSNSPVTPAALTMARICEACSPRLRALTVLASSSMEMFPLPSQSKTSNTSLSLATVSAVRFFLTYFEGSKAAFPVGLDIRYIQSNKKLMA